MNGLAHIGVEVHGVNEIYLRILLAEVFHGCDHADEAITEILATVAGDKHKPLTTIQTGYIVTGILQHIDLLVSQSLICLQLIYHHVEGIDNGITCYEDLALGLLLLQVMLAKGCRSKVVSSNTACNLAVHLLRPRAIDVMRTQTSLHMTNRNLLVEGCQGSSCAGSGIAMHQHYIGFALVEHIAHTREHTCCDIVEVLPLLHDVQVIIRLHVKDGEYLVQHFTVLTRHANNRFKLTGMFLELLY